jgi:dTDP-4-dehydrorhamnose reductase
MEVNGVASGVLGEEVQELGGVLIHYSTDYVFDGKKGSPYTEDDHPKPLSTYGKTKLAGGRCNSWGWRASPHFENELAL